MEGDTIDAEEEAPSIRSLDDVDLYEQWALIEAREDFWAFRCYLNPDMLKGWFQREVATELMIFYAQLCAGLRPYLVLSAPPQHGKSRQMVEFMAWIAGKNPDLKKMYASYSDELGTLANSQLQRIFESERYQKIFPGTRISGMAVASGRMGHFARNSGLLEYIDHKGSFRNTTVDGQINGMGLDFGLIDDPMKGRQEAQSKTIRDKTWNWFTDDFFGRFANHAGMIMIMTRWHVDDPVGRFISVFPRARVLRYQAIAEKRERNRLAGEALFPAHKPIEFLKERKAVLAQASWESVWQQNPIVVGGGMFPIEKFGITTIPAKADIKKSVRYWDKAGTEDGGAFTCGVLMHELKNGQVIVSDVRRGQWGALKREEMIRTTADSDKATWGRFPIYVEQEPGSGGKESAERTIAMLKGFNVFADRVTGAKEIRAEPYAAQVQGGNVKLVGAVWNQPFIDEHESFPGGKYKDQVDSAAGAFAKMLENKYGNYDTSMKWAVG
jgi:predicted phage terminase large subunit-like protein